MLRTLCWLLCKTWEIFIPFRVYEFVPGIGIPLSVLIYPYLDARGDAIDSRGPDHLHAPANTGGI